MDVIDFGELEGFQVGSAEDRSAGTGCTVILCGEGAVAGVDVRGGAPGTRETDLLAPVNLVERIHAVILAGGSAFGLDAAGGVMAWLEERGIGFDVGVARVPIVCGAVLFDLALGDPKVRPDAPMGRAACDAAGAPPRPGSWGAGTGASVGKLLGMDRAMKGGQGVCAFQVGNLKVAALVAVNCLGDVVDPASGQRLAGPLAEDRRSILDTEALMARASDGPTNLFAGNTSLGVVLTNAALTKAQATKLASMAQDGYARTMRPAHTMVDGDTIFVLSKGEIPADLNLAGMLAARAVEGAVLSAIREAEGLGGVPALGELPPGP